MKRIFILLLALSLVSVPCFAEGASDPFAGTWQDPYYDRAVLEINPVGERYDIRITWGSSADSEGVWEMDAAREGDSLVYTGGRMSVVTYAEGGEVLSEEVQYDDAEGAFTLGEDGKLSWADSREERAPEFAYERISEPDDKPAGMQTGSWTPSSDPTITEEVQSIFDKGMEGLVGVHYVPVAYLGSQLVAGRNHAILAQATVVYPNAQPRYVIVYLYEDLQGGVKIMNIADLDIGAMCEY